MSEDKVVRSELVRGLKFRDVLALGFGSIIGWGWIMLGGKWVSDGGVVGALLAFAFGTVMCICVGLVYSELTPMLPCTGSGLVYSYRGLGYNASFICGWFICLAYLGVACWEGPAFSMAISYIFEIPLAGYIWTVGGFDVYATWIIFGSIGAFFIGVINYRGTKGGALFQTLATFLLVIGGTIFFILALIKGETDHLVPVFTTGKGMLAVLLVVPAMFVGFDVIPQAAEEMDIPVNKIGKLVILSILMAAAWYMLVILGVAFSAPAEIRDAATIGVADSFAYAFGGSKIAGKFMILVGMLGILTSWNGFFMGTIRVLFAMSRTGMIPKIFSTLHPKYGTPSAATLLVTGLCMFTPFLGRTALVWFVDASSFATMVFYFLVVAAFIQLRKKEPDLERPFKLKNWKLIGAGAFFTCLFFLYLFQPLGPAGLVLPEWIVVGGWCVFGLILYTMQRSKYGVRPKEELDFLMFGPKYTRYPVPANAEELSIGIEQQ